MKYILWYKIVCIYNINPVGVVFVSEGLGLIINEIFQMVMILHSTIHRFVDYPSQILVAGNRLQNNVNDFFIAMFYVYILLQCFCLLRCVYRGDYPTGHCPLA